MSTEHRRTATMTPGSGPAIGLVQLDASGLGTARFFDLRRWSRCVFLGAGATCHVRLDDPTVSARHAAISREQGRVMLTPHAGAKTPVRVNGATITDPVPLASRDILQLGAVTLVVTDTAPEPGSVLLRGHDLHEFILCALDAYGSNRRAASGIGLDDTTLRRWIKRGKGRVRRTAPPMGVPVPDFPEHCRTDAVPSPVRDEDPE